MTKSTLHVGGAAKELGAEYTLGFYQSDAGPEAVLYHHGRRVTAEWSLRLEASQEEDPDKNANTAG